MALDIIDAAMATAGGIIGVVGTFLTQKKKDKRDDFAELFKAHNDLYTTVKNLYNETKAREDKCEESLRIMRQDMVIIQNEMNVLKARIQ